MLETMRTPDYAGNLRHECPQCRRPAAVRQLITRDEQGNVTSDIDYCEHIACGWQSAR